MYESYFQLREKPFDIVPNTAYLYLSRTHQQALRYLKYGLMERLGFVLMTGEVGAGKTTVIRELIKTLSPEFNIARLFNTRVGSDDLIAMINEDFGLDTAGKSKVSMLKELYAFLIDEYEEGRRPVLIIDEAQNLSPDLLEEIRMLSNLETDTIKLLQIILVGQPELAHILSLHELRQLRQRISMVCHLRPLTRPETEEYILHRLEIAGNREAVTFREGAFDAIYDVTHGIPRQINTLCNFLLLTAFSEEHRDVTVELVTDVAAELGFNESGQSNKEGGKETTKQPLSGNTGHTGKVALLRALGIESQNHDRTARDLPGKAQARPRNVRISREETE